MANLSALVKNYNKNESLASSRGWDAEILC